MSLKTTPLTHWHQKHGAELENGLVMKSQSQPTLGLTDLTALERVGFKGADSVDWLQSRGWTLPAEPNTSIIDRGVVVLRLSATEFFFAAVVQQANSDVLALAESWSMELEHRVYRLERAHSHACFAITGAETAEMLAKLCAVDLRDHRFAPLSVAQTSVARGNAILTRLHDQGDPVVLLCSDMTASEFMWGCLMDAMHEFAGGSLAYPDYLVRLDSPD